MVDRSGLFIGEDLIEHHLSRCLGVQSEFDSSTISLVR